MERVGFKRGSRSQFEFMMDFVEKYPLLFTGQTTEEFTRKHKVEKWRELSEILNAMPGGTKKTINKWRQSFKDYKFMVKKKYLTYLSDAGNAIRLSRLDVRFLAMMGFVVDVEHVLGAADTANDGGMETYLLEEILSDEDTTENNEKERIFCPRKIPPKILTIFPKETKDILTDTSKKKKPGKATTNSLVSDDIEAKSPTAKVVSNHNVPKPKKPSVAQKTVDDFCDDWGEVSNGIKKQSSPAKVVSNHNVPKPIEEPPMAQSTVDDDCENATAVALLAIAEELGVKNDLTKRKIELEEERLRLEKRKIEAFELIAKRLCRMK